MKLLERKPRDPSILERELELMVEHSKDWEARSYKTKFGFAYFFTREAIKCNLDEAIFIENMLLKPIMRCWSPMIFLVAYFELADGRLDPKIDRYIVYSTD